VKNELNQDIADLKLALAGSDEDAVRKSFEKLNQSQSKIGDEIYQAGASAPGAGEPVADSGDDVVDAEVVEDDK